MAPNLQEYHQGNNIYDNKQIIIQIIQIIQIILPQQM